jgi:adenylylsulfate kinase-like enzyme
VVIWILGLSGSGKSFLSSKLKEELSSDYGNFLILDGDVIRKVFDNDLGFSIKDRNINASRISKLTLFLSQNKVNVIVPVLSLFPDWLEWNKKNIKQYYEIFIDVPISTLKERNNKNVYFKEGKENENVVGVDIEFIKPKTSDLKIINNFDEVSLKKNLKLIRGLLRKND